MPLEINICFFKLDTGFKLWKLANDTLHGNHMQSHELSMNAS